MRKIRPDLVVREARWYDRFRTFFSRSRRRRLALMQTLLDEERPKLEERVRDLWLYGATYVDADGQRIPPEEVFVR